MKLLVISNAPIIKKDGLTYAYAPYISEMEIWAKFASEVAFCCPEWKTDRGLLIKSIDFKVAKYFILKDFNVKSFFSILNSILIVPINFFIIIRAMFWANHIHLRCPGNVGLLAAFAQLFFPNKVKTVKYAGNWETLTNTPLSYKIQKWILSNTFLSKKTKVLVYGNWPNSTKNIKPFFTASYSESEKEVVADKSISGVVKFMFVGMLTEGKQPIYALKLIEKLKKNYKVELHYYGEGLEREKIVNYVNDNKLNEEVFIHGNQNKNVLKKAFKESNFVILPSLSEGWPKVVAEGMFWKCVPIASRVSCVPDMLKNGERGVLLDFESEKDVLKIIEVLNNKELYVEMQNSASEWSRKFTTDYFKEEIKSLMQS